ncbi:phage neck terminator protein [Carnobacterium maltaromaticum]|uniref:phage neck terminator protein n=1 Tax=Carnobacterium maltaromaticum TaxID=2751 RepID=UPI00054F5DEF|nr:hypothetical protein [Carnobacterium maltaromaticum]KRN62445.1 hypothetical protein IV70_GL003561 [Carnobacterium maltaromaticum DSM 20342]
METTYDYKELIDFLIESVSLFSGKELIESNTIGDIPDYPYCAYTIISPYISITSDIVTGEQFECVVSLTWHCLSGLEALSLTAKTNKYFRTFEAKQRLEEKNIIFVSYSSSGQRDNFLSIEYERLAGCDLRFRLTDSYKDDELEIENIEL